MLVLSKILEIGSKLLDFIKKNPKFFFGVLFALMLVMLLKQCNDKRDLKYEIEKQKVIMENEDNRMKNNLESLNDSVVFYKKDNVYVKTMLRTKEGEIVKLDRRLSKAKKEIEELKKNSGKVSSIYITDISANITNNDVSTNVEIDGDGNFGVGIKDSNSVYRVNTLTWFKLTPNGDNMKLDLVNKFGKSPSQLNYGLNFSLMLSQVEGTDGKTRVIVTPKDKNGNPIPPDVLSIPYVNGVNFVDVEPKEKPLPKEPKKFGGFGMMVGPSYGLYQVNGTFIPTIGLGITLGYKIF